MKPINEMILATVANDSHMRRDDHVVAGALLSAFNKHLGYAQVSYSQLVQRTGLTLGVIRGSVNRLERHGYFKSLNLTQREISEGLHCLGHRYVPAKDQSVHS